MLPTLRYVDTHFVLAAFRSHSQNSALSHGPNVLQYLDTIGCYTLGVSALFLFWFKSNPYHEFLLGFWVRFSWMLNYGNWDWRILLIQQQLEKPALRFSISFEVV